MGASSTGTPARRSPGDNSALRDMARHVDELPLLPQVLVRILQLSPSADDYFEQFEELARQDPSFAVRVVALANSAASAPMVPVASIRESLTRMGVSAVNGLVASLAVQRVFMPSDPTQVRLWRHAIQVAVAAQKIAAVARRLGVDPGHAYLAGLLHDIGRFVMLEHAAPDLLKVDESKWTSPEELVQADVDVYTYTHSELGYLACRRWGLPDEVCHVVQTHHDKLDSVIEPGSVEATTFCVQIADRVSVFLLDAPERPDWSEQEIDDVLTGRCLRTTHERLLLPVARLTESIDAMENESERLLSGLGFG